jgi:hypothetical protein
LGGAKSYNGEKDWSFIGCALVFALEAKIEIEANVSFRSEEKKGTISLVSHRAKQQKSEGKTNGKEAK